MASGANGPPGRRPGSALPTGACDAHCDIGGPTDRFPFAERRPYTPPDRGKEVLAALYARLGIERSVVVQAIVHGTDNRAMLDAIASSGGRDLGIDLAEDSCDGAALASPHLGGGPGSRVPTRPPTAARRCSRRCTRASASSAPWSCRRSSTAPTTGPCSTRSPPAAAATAV